MNKFFRFALLLLVVIGLLWLVARMTNVLQFYRSPSTANAPSIQHNELLFASSLVKPKRFDFICYRADLPMMGRQIVTHRLCGLPGDTIELRNGDLFVNGKNADEQLSLTHNYRLSAHDFARLKEHLKIEEYWVERISPDSVELPLSDAFIREHQVPAYRKLVDEPKDESIAKLFGGHANQDRLGPVIVPKETYFVLGDNRHHTQDSRYLGFIDRSQTVATVLGK